MNRRSLLVAALLAPFLGSCDSPDQSGIPTAELPELLFARIVSKDLYSTLEVSSGFTPRLLDDSDIRAVQSIGLKGKLTECGSDGSGLGRKNKIVVVVRDMPTKPLTLHIESGKTYYLVEKAGVLRLPSLITRTPGSVTLSPDQENHLLYEYVMQTAEGPIRSLGTIYLPARE